MSYSFDRKVNKWETLADVFDVFQNELDNEIKTQKENSEFDFLDVGSFDEYEVL